MIVKTVYDEFQSESFSKYLTFAISADAVCYVGIINKQI